MDSAPIYVNLGPSWGFTLLMVIISAVLWGALCMQTILFFGSKTNDNGFLRALVIWIWMATATHLALGIDGIYTVLAEHFGDFEGLTTIPVEFFWQLLLTDFVTLTTQSFLLYRIWLFSKKNRVVLFIFIPPIVMLFGGDLAYFIIAVRNSTIPNLLGPVLFRMSYVLNGLSAGIDVCLAVTLVVLLKRNSTYVARKRTSRMIRRLSGLALITGAWTAVITTTSAITFAILPDHETYAALSLTIPLGPLYGMTVLANLNARNYILQGQTAGNTTLGNNNIITIGSLGIQRRTDDEDLTAITVQKSDNNTTRYPPVHHSLNDANIADSRSNESKSVSHELATAV